VPDSTGQFGIGVSAHLEIDCRDFGITWNQVVEMGGVLAGNMTDIGIDAGLTKRNVSGPVCVSPNGTDERKV
jgi:hypothetical protein